MPIRLLLACLLLPTVALAGGLPPSPAAATPAAAPAAVMPPAAAGGETLAAVRRAGQLSCGVVAEPEDWTKSDLHGNIAGFDIEICKAIAVAALGEHARLAMHLYASATEAGAGLHRGEVAVVAGVTPTLTAAWRDDTLFGPVIFYDGLAVLVRGDRPVTSLAGLVGLRVCYIQGTDNEDIVLARTVARGIKLLPFPFQEEGEMEDGLSARHCDAIAADVTHLAIERASYPKSLGRDRILPDWLTISPLAIATRRGDAQWALITAATVHALVMAEQLGITRANVAEAGKGRAADDPEVARLLGLDWAAARDLGLADHAWAAKVISVVGNYGEIYDRTVGRPDRLPRGRNALWNAGGLMVPLPVQ